MRFGQIERIENVIGSGTPDVYYTIEGVPGWIETKVAKKRIVYFEKYQLGWYRRHMRRGLKHLFISVLSNDEIYFYHAGEAVKAPREVVEKWTTVKMDDMTPDLVLSGTKLDWGSLRSLLIS